MSRVALTLAHGGPSGPQTRATAIWAPQRRLSAVLAPPRDAAGYAGAYIVRFSALQVPNVAEGPRRTDPSGRSGHAVSLTIKDERRVLAVAEQMVARHIPGLA